MEAGQYHSSHVGGINPDVLCRLKSLVVQACHLCESLRQEDDKLKASLRNPVRSCLKKCKVGGTDRAQWVKHLSLRPGDPNSIPGNLWRGEKRNLTHKAVP